jgi:hypothetical protein
MNCRPAYDRQELEGLTRFNGERWAITEKGDALCRPHRRKRGRVMARKTEAVVTAIVSAALMAAFLYWASRRWAWLGGWMIRDRYAIIGGAVIALFGAVSKAARNPGLVLGRLMKVCPGCGAEYAEPPKCCWSCGRSMEKGR